MIVKICGITRASDGLSAVKAGADWLGLNFWPRSPRAIDDQAARNIVDAVRQARPSVALVGVWVDANIESVLEQADRLGLDWVQLHGDETPDMVKRVGQRAIKAVSLASDTDVDRMADFSSSWFVVDTPSAARGGSGKVGNWQLAKRAALRHQIMLAGGLSPDNVAQAVGSVAPAGVDVASGVELEPGIKDARRMQDFVQRARAAARNLK